MLEFVCSIPEWFGWTMVSLLTLLCLVMLAKLGCVFAKMWKDYKEEKAFWEVHHCEEWEE